MWMWMKGEGGGKDQRVGGAEALIWIYHMKNNLFQLKKIEKEVKNIFTETKFFGCKKCI